MKPWLLVAIVLVAACGGSPPASEDVDARAPAAVEGAWAITWECVSCEPGAINPLGYTTVVEIGATTVVYSSPDCDECGGEHTGAGNADGTCIEVDGGGSELTWSAYELCGFGEELEGELTFLGYPGPPQARTYSVTGTR
jgi:hypothetical protein